MATKRTDDGTRGDVSPDGGPFGWASRPFAVIGLTVIAVLALNTAPTFGGSAANCARSAKPAFARVQLFKDPNCKGASVFIPKTGDGNRPNFALFRNYDETIRSVDNSRSSLAIDAGTCVRFFDAVNYTGQASTNICAGSGVAFWNLDRFDDRATSMLVCSVSAPAQCRAPTTTTPATPEPTQPTFIPKPRWAATATVHPEGDSLWDNSVRQMRGQPGKCHLQKGPAQGLQLPKSFRVPARQRVVNRHSRRVTRL